MSLRAIKKRENISRPYKKHPIPSNRARKISENHTELRKLSKSYPDLTKYSANTVGFGSTKLTSKSDTDVRKLAQQYEKNANLISAKSEVCLKTISVHSTVGSRYPMGARSERDLSSQFVDRDQSSPVAAGRSSHNGGNRRRMSENSLSVYSDHNGGIRRGFVDSSCVRVPIIGYEVMEERARFTVYKLRVENPFTNDCWLVMRRYTDFVRLNSKLKQLFPIINLQLPRKKIFGDNFNTVFLDNRVQGLQIFVNSVMANEELKNCKIVREFFCLDEPPTYSESMEECRAIFEAQEETIVHLKMQINSKNDLIMSLQQKLRNEMAEKEQLKHAVKIITAECSKCSISPALTALTNAKSSESTLD